MFKLFLAQAMTSTPPWPNTVRVSTSLERRRTPSEATSSKVILTMSLEGARLSTQRRSLSRCHGTSDPAPKRWRFASVGTSPAAHHGASKDATLHSTNSLTMTNMTRMDTCKKHALVLPNQSTIFPHRANTHSLYSLNIHHLAPRLRDSDSARSRSTKGETKPPF